MYVFPCGLILLALLDGVTESVSSRVENLASFAPIIPMERKNNLREALQSGGCFTTVGSANNDHRFSTSASQFCFERPVSACLIYRNGSEGVCVRKYRISDVK
jgi:hypothetical protein